MNQSEPRIRELFEYLKYVRPTWYFNRSPDIENYPYWIRYDILSDAEKAYVVYDDSFDSEAAALRDAAYQAWNAGVVHAEPSDALSKEVLDGVLSAADNYRFLRKYFSAVWVLYALLMRLLTLHNPFRELAGYLKTRGVTRSTCSIPQLYGEYETFRSPLLEEHRPFVTVVIPTLNRYKYLYDVMRDLEAQDYKAFEVVVVDQSEPFDAAFYNQFDLDMNVSYQEEKALWKARNHALKVSKGEYILLFDDDSRVDPDWISEHLKCLDYFQADISSGVSLSVSGGTIPRSYAYFRWSDQLDTGNAMIDKKVFHKIGMFDRQFEKQRMGDGEYGLRAYLNGFKNISNPRAKRVHLKVSSGGLRQMGSWDAFRTKKLFAPRPIPSVLYLFRKYFGTRPAIFSLLMSVPPSVIPYKYKSNKKLMLVGALIACIVFPLLLIQVGISWRRASAMLAEGDKIEPL